MIKSSQLQGKKVLVLITDKVQFEVCAAILRRIQAASGQIEFAVPNGAAAPRQLDALVRQIGGAPVTEACTHAAGQISAAAFAGLLIPELESQESDAHAEAGCAQLVREFFKLAKPVAVIGNGLQFLLAAGVVHQRTITSTDALRQSALSADAHWVDRPCVCDQGLVTSRTSADMEAFCGKAIEEFAEGTHVGQTV